jgi:hypothetical protein
MVAARQILDTFLKDSWRMSKRALAMVAEAEARLSNQQDVDASSVRTLFQLTHTMKGTACMIRDARPIVEALQELEGRLTVQTIEASAKAAKSWLPLARDSLERTRRELERLKLAISRDEIVFSDEQKQKKTEAVKDSTLGLILRVQGQKLSWLPLDRLNRVLSPFEISSRDMVLIGGRWVPVLRMSPQEGLYGVLAIEERGTIVLAVEAVQGIESWRRARLRGASSLVDLLPRNAVATSPGLVLEWAAKKVA